MAQTFFFYDLETSGLDPRNDRIMQFAGIRTDANFNQIGESYNILVALNDDTLPSPYALMVTGVTPQQTVADGYSEADFAKLFVDEICTPDTIILGYNSIRFDDEFIRALLWRNFYDPYEWSYKDGRSRWDLLDVVRMTRALRPDGIAWPVVDGAEVNKLELLSKVNGLEHEKAHDALSDVVALVGVAKLLHEKQPQLFDYLLKLRDKRDVQQLVSLERPEPFVYASGRYSAEYHKATVAYPLAPADHGNVLVYDLRHDPQNWVNKTNAELEKIVATPYKERDDTYAPLPVKKMQYNRAPAVAPISVLERNSGWQRLSLTKDTVAEYIKVLQQSPTFAERVSKILTAKADYPKSRDAEGQLYDGFVGDADRRKAEVVRNATRQELGAHQPNFTDKRLADLYVRYKARNFPSTLRDDERALYETWRTQRIAAQTKRFVNDLQAVVKKGNLTDHQQYVIEELQLWFESVVEAE